MIVYFDLVNFSDLKQSYRVAVYTQVEFLCIIRQSLLQTDVIVFMPYGIEYFYKFPINFENGLPGVSDNFTGNIVEFVSDGLNGMLLPVLLKGFSKKDKKIVG